MKKLFAVLLLFFASCTPAPALALAAPLAPEAVSVVVSAAPCSNDAVLAHIPDKHKAFFRAGEVRAGDNVFPACWGAASDGRVFIVLENGEGFIIPEDAFK